MTLSIPTALSSYKLIPAGQFYTTRRNGKPLGLGLHVTAGLQDLGMTGTDESMEGTIKWALDRRPEVSWNGGADSDGFEWCVPDWYTAWHIKGYNSRTVGIEISNLDAHWTNKPAKWIEATIFHAARGAAAYIDKYDWPLQLASKSAVDAAIANGQKFGVTYHRRLNPSTRIDPADPESTFPLGMFWSYVKSELGGGGSTPTTPTTSTPTPAPTNVLDVDGDLGPKSITQWQKVMRAMGHQISVDGKISSDYSYLVAAVQRHMRSRGIKDAEGTLIGVDGRGIGSNSTSRYPAGGGTSTDTIEALCNYLGIRVKGHFAESEEYTVKVLQKRLNTGKF